MMKKSFFYPVPLAGIILLCGAALCSGCYTLKQGTTMLGYLNRAIPLEDLLTAKTFDGSSAAASDEALAKAEDNRLFAERAQDIRGFAMNDLGLKESKNYTKYVELDRDYLAAVVSACAKDSFTRYEWWFPIVGSVPYKGFFNIEDARKERQNLEKKDLDVWIRGVDAFSTLGWFADPLYSYMKNYPPQELADLIIHELVHATIYLKNYSQFNEELAEFIGSEGSRLYMLKTYGSTAEEEMEKEAADNSADNAAFVLYIQNLIAQLDSMYNNPGLSREEKLNQKSIIISEAQARFMESYDQKYKTQNYRGFGDMQINNAYLDLYRLYYERNNWFRDVYEKSGSDLKTFIAAAKTLKGKDDPRIELQKALGLL
ncbi:MAG: aminopeptidase [Treponema sp.]|nr:aminopeptidase [Treponema sp.]